MNNDGQIRYELLLSKRGMPYETARERQSRLAAAARPWTPNDPGRRMVARLGNLLALGGSLLGFRRRIGMSASSRHNATRNAVGTSRLVSCT
jgi:hypothetical protein